jgi:hypothetical protein
VYLVLWGRRCPSLTMTTMTSMASVRATNQKAAVRTRATSQPPPLSAVSEGVPTRTAAAMSTRHRLEIVPHLQRISRKRPPTRRTHRGTLQVLVVLVLDRLDRDDPARGYTLTTTGLWRSMIAIAIISCHHKWEEWEK